MFKRFLKSGPGWEKWGKMGKNGEKSLSQSPHLYTTHVKLVTLINQFQFTPLGKGQLDKATSKIR